MDLIELKKIGLTDGEIKVYQALLDLGECTKTALAKKSEVAPSNIYDITNRLLEKGIISKVEKNGVAHFSAANPNCIKNYLETKEKEIEKEKDILNQILPTLLLKYSEKKESTNVEVFQGWSGMKTVFLDLIDECNKNDKCYVFGASKGENDKQADLFFVKYSRLRETKGIMTHIVFNEEMRKRTERIEYFQKSKYYKIKFLNQNTPAEIMLYKNKTCILLLTENPMTIRITSKEAADSFKQNFDLVWNLAKE